MLRLKGIDCRTSPEPAPESDLFKDKQTHVWLDLGIRPPMETRMKTEVMKCGIRTKTSIRVARFALPLSILALAMWAGPYSHSIGVSAAQKANEPLIAKDSIQ